MELFITPFRLVVHSKRMPACAFLKENMKITILRNIIITAALGLTMNAESAPKRIPTVITQVPFVIIAPGTYVLASDLVDNSIQDAITISLPTPGKVILDLQGFTLINSIPVGTVGDGGNGVVIKNNPTGSTITVRNGTIQEFFYDVLATSCTNVHVEHLKLIGLAGAGAACVAFTDTSASSVDYCSFFGIPQGSPSFGILDEASQAGNSYSNDTFDNPTFLGAPLQVTLVAPLTLRNCQFEVTK